MHLDENVRASCSEGSLLCFLMLLLIREMILLPQQKEMEKKKNRTALTWNKQFWLKAESNLLEKYFNLFE